MSAPLPAVASTPHPWRGPLDRGPTPFVRGLGRAVWLLWLGTAATMPFSIALTHLTFFGGLGLFVLWATLAGAWPEVWAAQPKAVLAAYGVYLLVVFVSGLTSEVPGEVTGIFFQKRLTIALALPAFAALRPDRAQLTLWLGAFLTGMAAVTTVALGQYAGTGWWLIGHPDGFGGEFRLTLFNHALTSGQLLGIGIALVVAWLVAGPRRRPLTGTDRALLGLLGLLLVAFGFNFTRSAWIAVSAAVALILVLHRRWLLLGGLPVYWAFLVLILPLRFIGGDAFSTKEASTSLRLEIWRVGLEVYRDHPILGVGDRDMHVIFRRYRPNATEQEVSPVGHFHSTAIHTAASLGTAGLVAALALFGLWGRALWRAWRDRLGPRGGSPATLGLATGAAYLAFHLAGIFEANFGDLEVIIVLLALSGLTLGLAADRAPDPS